MAKRGTGEPSGITKEEFDHQHQFNESVLYKVEAAQKSLRFTPLAVEKAKEALGEGEQLIKNRQKKLV